MPRNFQGCLSHAGPRADLLVKTKRMGQHTCWSCSFNLLVTCYPEAGPFACESLGGAIMQEKLSSRI